MLKEGPAPVTAYKSGAKTVLLRREKGGDDGKDIQWDTVYGSEGVPPLAGSRQRGRNVLVKLRDVIEGEAIEEVRVSFPKAHEDLQHTTEKTLRA